jgi:glycine/D-amino acid oxidase-like deaminating enzyme
VSGAARSRSAPRRARAGAARAAGGLRVCVVGAGAVGLSCALQLARRGVREVTVLESRHVAAGSSGLSVGIVETQYLQPLDIELRVRAMGAFRELEREHGLRLVRNGYLRLGHDERDREAFERSARAQRELGVADAQVLEREQLARLVPDLRVQDVCAGLWGPSDGYLDGHLYCGLLAELARAAGARVLAPAALLGAEPLPGARTRLATSAGALECEAIVIAAGAWAGRVASVLGRELRIVPQRAQACVVGLPRELPYTMPSVMDYTPGSGAPGLYFRHERAGRLIAGLHSEEALDEGVDLDRWERAADADFLEALARALCERLPGLSDATLSGGWAGLYPVSAAGGPLVGPLEGDGARVIAAAGAGGSGIQLSPALGELAADWVLERPLAIPAARGLAPRPR